MSESTFNPLTQIPTTDEEAKTALMYGKVGLIGKNLVGIFECSRAQGEPLLKAYKSALWAHVGKYLKDESEAK